ncbi:MAG: site-specific integrase [Psychrosphaera sp.]|nr:site-specific integrase [Psychrosphaera sp.]
MSTTIKFIDTVIRNLKPTDKRQVLWCDGCPGFGLRITPSGTKSFVYKYMNGRQSRWITIGKYPEYSIRQARQQYDQYCEQVKDYGRDPVFEAKEEQTLLNKKQKFAEFLPVYVAMMRLKGKASIDEEERAIHTHVLPVIGNLFLDEITPNDIEQIQMRIINNAKSRANATRGGKVAVKNTLAYTRQVFNVAKKKGLIENNPVESIVSLGVAGRRDRVLSFKEIWLFWNKLADCSIPPVTANALKFLLVTMQRSTEVRHVQYSSIKVDENIWQMEVHETKNRTMHRVPLNRYAHDLIAEVAPFTGASPYIFAATRSQTPPLIQSATLKPFGITALPQAIRKSLDTLGIHDFRPHDLRRTGATWITAVGLPKLYARLMLNHNDGDKDVTGEVYVQYSYDFEKRRAVDIWAFILDQIVTCKRPDDIPNLEALRKRVSESGLL